MNSWDSQGTGSEHHATSTVKSKPRTRVRDRIECGVSTQSSIRPRRPPSIADFAAGIGSPRSSGQPVECWLAFGDTGCADVASDADALTGDAPGTTKFVPHLPQRIFLPRTLSGTVRIARHTRFGHNNVIVLATSFASVVATYARWREVAWRLPRRQPQPRRRHAVRHGTCSDCIDIVSNATANHVR